MNARRLAVILVICLAGLAFAAPSIGQQPDQIIVNNADEVIETPVSGSPDLSARLALLTPRVVVEYANEVHHTDLVVVPTPLQALLDQVVARVVVEYANTVNRENLVPIPDPLQQRLNQVAERIVFAYANINREYALFYPVDLIGDTVPPIVSDPSAQRGNVIAWVTDEFADSTVLYGTSPGAYSQTVSDPLYVKQHHVPLTGLTPGMVYYCVVRSTDRSGNTTTSAEFSFKATLFAYLPVVLRHGP